MTSRPLSIAVLACAAWATAPLAQALGFGRTPESIAFGRALDLSVPLRLDAGETLEPACVRAHVQLGDHRLAPDLLQMAVEPTGAGDYNWRVRLRSTQVVQEPLVSVQLEVGCVGSVSRQFIVFADPPQSLPEPAKAVAAEPMPAAPLPAAQPGPTPRVDRTVASAPRPPARKSATSKPTKTQLAARKSERRRTEAPPTPRLKLEEPEELLKAATLAVAAQDAALAAAAQAASAAEASAALAEQRLQTMNASLQTMRDEAASHRLAMEQMRERLAQAEEKGSMQSLLAAVVAGLALLALWLGWRLRMLQRERRELWWQGAVAPVEGTQTQGQADVGEAQVPDGPAEPVRPVIEAPDDVKPMTRTAPLTLASLEEEPLLRPVSVDELIDLEQQAEFFLVLGEEDAAVDLLMTHLRGTGGTSPLPYLKLLEIYRRRGDREAYERMRSRFGQRFNAVAPAWEADTERGRELQDYPEVLAALQATWPQPLDAMAELENLLFRKRSGELFELPAYRDVLTLYSVARDLHRQLDRGTTDVDVLLPLGSQEAVPSIFDNLDSSFPESAAEDRPTAPVDLDLSEPQPVRATLP